MTVAEGSGLWRLGGGFWVGALGGLEDFVWIAADEDVPAGLDGFDPFGFGAQGDAGDAEEEGFFLDAAGVGEDLAGVLFEHQHVEVADGIDGFDALEAVVQVGELFAGAGVDGEDDGLVDGVEGGDDVAQGVGVVGVGGAMEGGEQVLLGLQVQVGEEGGVLVGALAELTDGVVHGVADWVDALGDAFVGEVQDGGLGGAEEQVGAAVGEDAVVFFGHLPVEGA